MILTTLKGSAVFLALLWVICLMIIKRMASQKRSRYNPERNDDVEDEIKLNLKPDPKQENVTITSLFTEWREQMTGEEQPQIIVESSRWKQDNPEYVAFMQFCKEQNIKIIKEENLNPQEYPVVYFDDPMLMSLLWKKGYCVKVVKGRSLTELLESVDLFTLILISVKDDGSQALNHKWQEKLMNYGIHQLTREYLRSSYLNIIWKKGEREYRSLYEEISAEPISIKYKPGDKIKEFNVPVELEVRSAGLNGGNYASIRIDGQEFSPDLRGMNIVFYDLIESKVREIHRVDTFVSIFEDKTIYQAYLEEEHHAS